MNTPQPVPRPPRKKKSPTPIPASLPNEPIAESPPPPRKRAPRKVKKKLPVTRLRYKILLISLEVLGLIITAVSAIIVFLGYSASRFAGTRLLSNLLPFAIGVLVIVLLAAMLLIGWWKLRKYFQSKAKILAPAFTLCLAAGIGWFGMQNSFSEAIGHFRGLVGGKQEAGRVTLAHQVYAAYRRYDRSQLLQLMTRAETYNPAIKEAANAFELDVHILQGVAATESSFVPRESADGGQGLFQITAVPQTVLDEAGQSLNANKLSLANPRHNAFIAAATLKHYLAEMHDDLFLGLLAYNIGPKNGGLRFIMQQYGATDFVTIQPYLQQLPRDYPIRVLSFALAFRLWQREGKLLNYEEGNNAVRIQSIGVPGLETQL